MAEKWGSSFSRATSATALWTKHALRDSNFSRATSAAVLLELRGLVLQSLTRLWTEGIAGAELEVGLSINFLCLGDWGAFGAPHHRLWHPLETCLWGRLAAGSYGAARCLWGLPVLPAFSSAL